MCVGAYEQAEVNRQTSGFFATLISLKPSPSLNQKLTVSARLAGQHTPAIQLVLPPILGLQAHTTVPDFLHECWEFELRTS